MIKMGKNIDMFLGLSVILGIPASWILWVIAVVGCLSLWFGLVMSIVFLILCFVVWLPINIVVGLIWASALSESW